MWNGRTRKGLDHVHVLYLDVWQLDWCKEQTILSCPACLQPPEVPVTILHCELAIPWSPLGFNSILTQHPVLISLAFVSFFYMPLVRTQSFKSFDCDMPVVSSCNPPSLSSSDSLQTKAEQLLLFPELM
jgi:hypothetical protein